MRSRFAKLGAIIALGAAAISLAACTGTGGGSEDSKTEGPATIRFTYWGSDARQKLQQQVIDGFEKKYPKIKVESEMSNYDDYITKLSTAAAANDLPDVMTMIDPFMNDYIDNDSLLDLNTVKNELDLSDFPKDTFAGVTGADGQKYGVSMGVAGHGLIVNPDVFAKYGVKVPDDKSWSWDDFSKAATDISKKSGGAAVGFNLELTEQVANLWLRQNGERFGEGKNGKPAVDFKASTMADFFTFEKKLIDEKATNSPDQAQELFSAGNSPQQSLIAQNKAGIAMISMNQLGQFEAAAGHALKPVLWPGESQAKDRGGWTKQGTFLSINANTKYPKSAATFVNYLSNDVAAAKIMGLDRGVPANPTVAKAIEGGLTESDQRFVEWVNESKKVNTQPYYQVNTGVATVLTDSFAHANESVIFGTATPKDAANSLYDQLKSAASE